MKRTAIALIAAVAAAGAAAAVEPAVGAKVGATPSEIAAALGASGYAVRRVERSGERIEVHVEKDGARSRFWVDAPSGEIAELGGAGPLGRGALLGAGPDAAVAALRAEGYDVRQVEHEHGRLEIKALKDGVRYEFTVDPRSGEVLREQEDE